MSKNSFKSGDTKLDVVRRALLTEVGKRHTEKVQSIERKLWDWL